MTDTMRRRLIVEFTKMNGAGNDFIVIDNRFYHFSVAELSTLAGRYCVRRTGIGADGLLALEAATSEGCDYRMRYLNADGSVGTMCGNGARCLARYARSAGFDKPHLRFETDGGIYEAEVPDDNEAPIRLTLPPYRDYRAESGLSATENEPDAHYVWTGTEHLVVFVASVDEAAVAVDGPRLRAHRRFGSAGANVDFVEVAGAGHIRMRTWEKGVEGETLACGTGATAAAVVACLTGRVEPGRIDVDMPGGRLTVETDGSVTDTARMILEGGADVVYRGTLEM